MSMLAFANPDGSPNASALYTNAVLCAGLYHQDDTAFKKYAAATGCTFRGMVGDKNSFEPDYGVITGPGEALVVFDGTTNSAQWVSHSVSAFFPLTDVSLSIAPLDPGPFVVGSFYFGLNIVENAVSNLIDSSRLGTVRITGHSYGAAAAFIFARHLAYSFRRPARIELMTFGQPRTYDGTELTPMPDYYVRLIAKPNTSMDDSDDIHVDPVTLSPPGLFQFFKTDTWFRWLRKYLGLSWGHHGESWVINANMMQKGKNLPFPFGLIPTLDMRAFIGSLPLSLLHLMDSSYLISARNAWQRAGVNNGPPALRLAKAAVEQDGLDLRMFDVNYAQYTGTPFRPANVLGPPVPAAVLNASFAEPPEQPVTDAERPQWATVSFTATIANVLSLIEAQGPTFAGGGAGGARTFWEFRGFDRRIQEMLQNAMAAILKRDAELQLKFSYPTFDADVPLPPGILEYWGYINGVAWYNDLLSVTTPSRQVFLIPPSLTLMRPPGPTGGSVWMKYFQYAVENSVNLVSKVENRAVDCVPVDPVAKAFYLIRRRDSDLLALPGGFIDEEDGIVQGWPLHRTTTNASLRELLEETESTPRFINPLGPRVPERFNGEPPVPQREIENWRWPYVATMSIKTPMTPADDAAQAPGDPGLPAGWYRMKNGVPAGLHFAHHGDIVLRAIEFASLPRLIIDPTNYEVVNCAQMVKDQIDFNLIVVRG